MRGLGVTWATELRYQEESAKTSSAPGAPLPDQSDTCRIVRERTVAGGRFAPGQLGELTQIVPFSPATNCSACCCAGSPNPPDDPPIRRPGPDGGDDINTALVPATTVAKRQAVHDHEIYGWSTNHGHHHDMAGATTEQHMTITSVMDP
jgi:hypothetical protein